MLGNKELFDKDKTISSSSPTLAWSSVGQKQSQQCNQHVLFARQPSLAILPGRGSGPRRPAQAYLQHVIVHALHSEVEGCHHGIVSEVWVGSFAEKKLNTFNLVLSCRPVQRGVSIIVHYIQH